MKHIWLFALFPLLLGGCSPEDSTQVSPPTTNEPIADAQEPASSESTIRISDSVSYVLENAESQQAAHPETFWIPSRDKRESLQPDQLVKLMFRITAGDETLTERMWVIVREAKSDEYLGILDNDPYCTDEMKSGLQVRFKPHHVIDIYEMENSD